MSQRKIILTERFKDDIKFYVRKKKYTKIESDIATVMKELKEGNLIGDRLEDLDIPEGTAVYKVRVANSSANVGKSNGFRLLYYVVIEEKIYLVSIYSKKDDVRVISDEQIELLIRNIPIEEHSDENQN